jgi:hypothetical protein
MNPILQTCSPINSGSNFNNNYPPIYPPMNNNNNLNLNNFNCGSYGYMDQNSRSCKCNNSYVWAIGGCKQPQNCASNSLWTGDSCACNYGYVKNNNSCQSVKKTIYFPPNSQFNGVNCQCNPGFYPINGNGQCTQCPLNSYWTGQGCGLFNSCRQGFSWDENGITCNLQNTGCSSTQYWDGANCRCNQGSYFINGVCTQCQLGTSFDGKQCAPISFSVKCTDPYSFYNGQFCVCIDGYYQMNGGVCVACPPQFQWSGVSCNPLNSNLKAYNSPGVSPQYSSSVAVQIR